MVDITKWLTDEVIEDFQEKPIFIHIEDLSKKFDIDITIVAKPKEAK